LLIKYLKSILDCHFVLILKMVFIPSEIFKKSKILFQLKKIHSSSFLCSHLFFLFHFKWLIDFLLFKNIFLYFFFQKLMSYDSFCFNINIINFFFFFLIFNRISEWNKRLELKQKLFLHMVFAQIIWYKLQIGFFLDAFINFVIIQGQFKVNFDNLW